MLKTCYSWCLLVARWLGGVLGDFPGGVSCWEAPIGVHNLSPAVMDWRMGIL